MHYIQNQGVSAGIHVPPRAVKSFSHTAPLNIRFRQTKRYLHLYISRNDITDYLQKMNHLNRTDDRQHQKTVLPIAKKVVSLSVAMGIAFAGEDAGYIIMESTFAV